MRDTCFERFVINRRLALSRDKLNSASQIWMYFRKGAFIPPEVTHPYIVIAHWESLAHILQEARLGGHHSPLHLSDLRGSKCILGQII